jgi:hypothetical protein
MKEIDHFFRTTGKVVLPLTVREILDASTNTSPASLPDRATNQHTPPKEKKFGAWDELPSGGRRYTKWTF